jgi:hypothetical protein
VGIAVSIAERATPMHDEERSTSMRVSSRALAVVAQLGGPRCCPRATYACIEFGCMELGALGYRMEFTGPRGRCAFSQKNKDCIEERCPFYPARIDPRNREDAPEEVR